MSTYFATRDTVEFNSVNRSIPVEIHHGMYDPVVPAALGQASHELLKSKRYDVELKNYPMEHSVCPQQINDISSWLVKVLAL